MPDGTVDGTIARTIPWRSYGDDQGDEGNGGTTKAPIADSLAETTYGSGYALSEYGSGYALDEPVKPPMPRMDYGSSSMGSMDYGSAGNDEPHGSADAEPLGSADAEPHGIADAEPHGGS